MKRVSDRCLYKDRIDNKVYFKMLYFLVKLIIHPTHEICYTENSKTINDTELIVTGYSGENRSFVLYFQSRYRKLKFYLGGEGTYETV